MRLIFPLLLAAVTVFTANAAEARRRGSSSQDLIFVSDTKVEIDGTKFALCHLVETNSIFFVNLFRSLEGYVLAPNKCIAERYMSLSDADLAKAKASGAIPESVPATAKLAIKDKIMGHWGWLLVLAVVAFAGMGYLNTRKRRKAREALMGDATPTATAILDAMCHAAKVDGVIAPEEVTEIQNVAQQMTGQTFTTETVRQIADLADEDLSDSEFKRFAKGRNPEEKELMMKGVLMVVASDGQLDGKEQKFVGKLGGALAMSGEQINTMLAEIVQKNQSNS
ncbi:TerB family tellurite resistance protein [Lentibacter algarum]|uniref:tellurite resistance TerB family protein n=1 Tax=Lentibacter algarum TaxID=576131 RepID=UPI001C0A21A1|nr:TerB family tellurite resistance protein [Lentibacter algarum]MBU2983561.1 TerB family tellurite resistance protein [Lentibacter algarum]